MKNTTTNTTWLDEITFNEQGLIPAIAQDAADGQILMVAWMNKESLALTAEKQQAVYWSRSRKKLWHKGETSGHFQKVHDIFLDCDADVICLLVTQLGSIACHTGRRSCFYQKLVDGQWQTIAPVLKNPDDIYGDKTDKVNKSNANESNTNESQANDSTDKDKAPVQQHSLATQADTLSALSAILESRKTADADSSYVASLYHKGINKILEKIGEEAVEVIIAAKDLSFENRIKSSTKAGSSEKTAQESVIYEVADLWFHTMVMLSHFNIAPQQVLDELARRFGVSGHAEKAARKH